VVQLTHTFPSYGAGSHVGHGPTPQLLKQDTKVALWSFEPPFTYFELARWTTMPSRTLRGCIARLSGLRQPLARTTAPTPMIKWQAAANLSPIRHLARGDGPLVVTYLAVAELQRLVRTFSALPRQSPSITSVNLAVTNLKDMFSGMYEFIGWVRAPCTAARRPCRSCSFTEYTYGLQRV
jgi:hypothetical protein